MMTITASFVPLQMPLYNRRTYLFAFLFIAGNLLTPQLVHLVPKGGLIFLPIYFFTLIGAYKFGWKVGLLTAVFSPLLNHYLFGMPPAFVLPAILVKSCLLAFIASEVAFRSKKVSIFLLLIVVLAYQIIGSLAEWAITQSFSSALQDFRMGIPGMLLQIFGGWVVLKILAKYAY
jgi:hypothetical protein